MRILIVEDERPTAEDIRSLVERLLKDERPSVRIATTLGEALAALDASPADVVLLDLNLHAKDGFDVLKHLTAGAFQTIVISANIHRAIEAYEHGVLDFIPKPYTMERLTTAFDRLKTGRAPEAAPLKFLSVKSGHGIQVVPLADVRFFRSANVYVELHLADGRTLLYGKPLKSLLPLLPPRYVRLHKSYIADAETVVRLESRGGGEYRAVLKSGDILPVSRRAVSALKARLGPAFG